MKTKKIFIVALIALILTSCASSSYYQVYKAAPTDKSTFKDSSLVYEDENCIVYYNLWDKEGGNIGFRFYNKTDTNIYLNMEGSFFVLNGIANNYYKNRVYSNSSSSGTSTTSKKTKESKSNSVDNISVQAYSVSYNEEKMICIPPFTSKIISEYTINNILFRDCDIFKYPFNKKEIKTKIFTKSNSPFVFSNIIVYYVGQSENSFEFVNEFYVTEITNYPKSEIVAEKYISFCGHESMMEKMEYFINVSPDKFYIEYEKGQDSWEH